jgi:hypothetical protein
MSELLNPYRKDIRGVYENEFARMSNLEVSVEELEAVRETLIKSIHSTMTDAEKNFLLSFKSKSPDWQLLGLENHEEISKLPSVRWKMLNLEKMPMSKHTEAYKKLFDVLQIRKNR